MTGEGGLLESTNTFSNVFIGVVVLSNFIRSDFSISLAGVEIINHKDITLRWKIFLIISSTYFILSFILIWIRCSSRLSKIRRMAYELGTPSRLAAPNCYQGPRRLSKRIVSWELSGIYIKTLLTLSVTSLSFFFNAAPVFFVFIFLCTLVSALVHLTQYNEWKSQNSTLNRISISQSSVMVETLLYQCHGYDYNREKILLGFGKLDNDYKLIGGRYIGDDLRDAYQSRLTPGLADHEIIVYANKNSIIRMFNCDVNEIKKLSTLIRYSTEESNDDVMLTAGVLGWALAISNLFNDVFGPGPWPGVDNIESSIIWIGIIAILARFMNTVFGIAYFRRPLSGKTQPNRIICQWQDASEQLWDILSDDSGIIHIRTSENDDRPLPDISQETTPVLGSGNAKLGRDSDSLREQLSISEMGGSDTVIVMNDEG